MGMEPALQALDHGPARKIGGMGVARLVGKLMMAAMDRNPRHHRTTGRHGTENDQSDGDRRRRGKGAVREQSMEARRQAETGKQPQAPQQGEVGDSDRMKSE